MSRVWSSAALRIAILLAVGGCAGDTGREGGSGARSGPGGAAGGPPAATMPTEYATSLLFLQNEGQGLEAVHLFLSHHAEPSELQRRYQGWILTGPSWRSILSSESREPAARAPWRLLPADSFGLIVTDEGEPDALMVGSGTRATTLDLGGALERWEDRGGIRHEVRFGRLVRRGESRAGILLEHRFIVPGAALPARFGPYQSAILRTADGLVLVLFRSDDPETHGESFAWLYNQGLSRRWTGLETGVVEVVSDSRLRRNVPVRIWFDIPEANLRGELTTSAREIASADRDRGPVPYHGLYRVEGWLEFESSRHTLQGVLVRGEP